MNKLTSLLLILTFCLSAVTAQDRSASFDSNRLRERVKRLSADDFEGRGPGRKVANGLPNTSPINLS